MLHLNKRREDRAVLCSCKYWVPGRGACFNFLARIKEVTVKLRKLSPVTSALVSLLFVMGILAADLTKARIVPAAKAQGRSTPVTISLSVANARLKGGRIIARGVVVNGVATDALFVGKVGIANSVLVSDGSIGFDGIVASGESSVQRDGIVASGESSVQTDGIVASGELSVQTDGIVASGESSVQTDGIVASGESATQGGTVVGGDITAAGDVEIAGGVVSGGNVRVVEGIIRGDDLTVSSAVVSGSGLRISGATIASPGH
jgi:hypothetical protein